MTDAFALLGVPRRPWIDPDELKERFHALAAKHHPDVNSSSTIDFAQLNSAYATLRSPVTRLRHLLELDAPDALRHSGQMPDSLVDLFMRIGRFRATLEKLLAARSTATSPLSHAVLAPERNAVRAQLDELLSETEAAAETCVSALREIEPGETGKLGAIYRQLAFLDKWAAHLREARLKLAS